MKRAWSWVAGGFLIVLLAGCGPSLNEKLMAAAGIGDSREVQRLLSAGAKINVRAPSIRRYTPLLFAVTGRHTDVVRTLLEAGADPNLGDHQGASPLHHALDTLDDNSEIVRQLVLHGADTNSVLLLASRFPDDHPNRRAFNDAVSKRIRDDRAASE